MLFISASRILKGTATQSLALGCVLMLCVPAKETPVSATRADSAQDSPLLTYAAATPENFFPCSLAPLAAEGNSGSYFELIHRAAAAAAMPADLGYAVAFVETGLNPEAIGDVGEVGLMQVRPQTAAMMGFRGTDRELAAPQTNISYGVAYLAGAWRLSGGDICRALMKYRAGHNEERMTARSVEYCARAKNYLKRIGSSLGSDAVSDAPLLQASIKQPEIPAIRIKSSRPAAPRRIARHLGSERFWMIHEARIRVMKLRVYAKWRQMAGAHVSRL
jgi:hypothetical protein